MDQTAMMRPVQLSDTYYYGVMPVISKVAAQMDDMSVDYPTQGMYDAMLDQVYDQMATMYPQEVQAQGASAYEQVFTPFGRRPLLRDLLGILLLQELFERRRGFHHFRR